MRQVFSCSLLLRHACDHELGIIAKAFLCGEEGAEAARILATNLLSGILDYTVAGYRNYPRLLDALAICCPTIFLDVFLGSQVGRHETIRRIFDSAFCRDELGHRYNSLGLIENELLLTWCETDPENRFLALAEAVQLCCSTPDETGRSNLSWSPLALELLLKAPKIDDILESLMSVFFPRFCTELRADMIVQRLPLLRSLDLHSNPVVVSWASAKRAILAKYIDNLRVKEGRDYGVMSQRFE